MLALQKAKNKAKSIAENSEMTGSSFFPSSPFLLA